VQDDTLDGFDKHGAIEFAIPRDYKCALDLPIDIRATAKP